MGVTNHLLTGMILQVALEAEFKLRSFDIPGSFQDKIAMISGMI